MNLFIHGSKLRNRSNENLVSGILNIGVVGLGFGSRVHVPAFRSDQRCRIAAITGRDAERARAVANGLSIENSYDDWRCVVNNRSIDAISIAVPPLQQPPIAIAALEAGKHVFCEKPLATNGSEAARLLKIAKSKHVVHAIDFIFPELPLWVRARDLIRRAELGQIRHVVLNWRLETYGSKSNMRSWKNDPSRGGGVLNNFVSHVVHNLTWLFGEIDSVNTALRGPDEHAETCAHATFDMKAGFPVFISVGVDAFLGQGHRLEVFGQDATMILQNPTLDYACGFELYIGTRARGSFELLGRDHPRVGEDGRIAPVAQLASRFVETILTHGTMTPNFEDGLRSQLMLDQMRESNRANRIS
jgi:predicted dehydrogenase